MSLILTARHYQERFMESVQSYTGNLPTSCSSKNTINSLNRDYLRDVIDQYSNTSSPAAANLNFCTSQKWGEAKSCDAVDLSCVDLTFSPLDTIAEYIRSYWTILTPQLSDFSKLYQRLWLIYIRNYTNEDSHMSPQSSTSPSTSQNFLSDDIRENFPPTKSSSISIGSLQYIQQDLISGTQSSKKSSRSFPWTWPFYNSHDQSRRFEILSPNFRLEVGELVIPKKIQEALDLLQDIYRSGAQFIDSNLECPKRQTGRHSMYDEGSSFLRGSRAFCPRRLRTFVKYRSEDTDPIQSTSIEDKKLREQQKTAKSRKSSLSSHRCLRRALCSRRLAEGSSYNRRSFFDRLW